MIYNNACIQWDKRSDLPKLYLIFRYIDNCIGSQYSTGRDYLYNEVVVLVGRIPFDYQKMFLKKINDSLIDFFSSEIYFPRDGFPCSEVRLCKYDELNEEQQWEEVRSRKIENLSACIQEVKDDLEELEKTLFREGNGIEIQTNIVPVVSNLPAIPAAVASVPFSGDSPAVPASAPVADVPVDITSIRPYPQIFAQGDEAASTFDNSGAAGIVVAVETFETVKSMDKKLDSMPDEIANTVVRRLRDLNGKIDSLDKIPDLNLDSGEWLIASEYAKTKNISIDTLKQGRSNVKKNNGNTKGLVAEDGSCGIHGKHVWRLGGYDNYNNGIYYYYIYGVDGKYTP